jgi:hypothetical protein
VHVLDIDHTFSQDPRVSADRVHTFGQYCRVFGPMPPPPITARIPNYSMSGPW